jgi:uncharacterized protein YozE (UPF0346 family)
MTTTFRAWLSRQKTRDDAIGDLARDAARDRCFPHRGDLDRYRAHLDQHAACLAAYETLIDAWTHATSS